MRSQESLSSVSSMRIELISRPPVPPLIKWRSEFAVVATAAPAPVIRPRVGMSDGDMHAFLMHSLGIENCEYTAQQLFNAAKETLLWADVRIELKLSAPSAMDLRTALLEAIKAATMGNSGGALLPRPPAASPRARLLNLSTASRRRMMTTMPATTRRAESIRRVVLIPYQISFEIRAELWKVTAPVPCEEPDNAPWAIPR